MDDVTQDGALGAWAMCYSPGPRAAKAVPRGPGLSVPAICLERSFLSLSGIAAAGRGNKVSSRTGRHTNRIGSRPKNFLPQRARAKIFSRVGPTGQVLTRSELYGRGGDTKARERALLPLTIYHGTGPNPEKGA